jgi:hypothetical protein
VEYREQVRACGCAEPVCMSTHDALRSMGLGFNL